MKSSILALIFLSVFITDINIPQQNITKDNKPDSSSACKGTIKLLEAIKTNDPSIASDFFFPAKAFDIVKNMKVPGRYHKKLLKGYNEDISKEHKRFKNQDWKFDKIEIGKCKWKQKGTEGNKIPYWSCRRNFVTAKAGDKIRRFEIRVLINWGNNWYITHLGAIHK